MNITKTILAKKTAYGAATALLSASLILSACGSEEPPLVEPTTAPAAEATVAPTSEPTAEATSTPADSGVVTDTQGVTGTEGATGSEGMTGTEVVTETTIVTGVDTTTRTGSMTETQGVTGTEGTTDTQGSTTGASSGSTSGTTAEAMRGSGVSGVEDQLVRASALLDYNFENADGEVSGELQDLLIDLETGRILFATVEYGGFLELGDRDLALPLSAFVIDEEGNLVLNFDEQTLTDFPDLGENWPDLTNPSWDDDVNNFWTNANVTPWQGFEEPTGNVVWASDLIGYGLAELGEGAGTISDLLVDLGNGTVRYVLAGYGAGAALDAPFILPISVLNLDDRGDVLAFDADIDPEVLLTAPRLDRSIYPDDTPLEPGFDTDILTYWRDTGIDINPWDGQ